MRLGANAGSVRPAQWERLPIMNGHSGMAYMRSCASIAGVAQMAGCPRLAARLTLLGFVAAALLSGGCGLLAKRPSADNLVASRQLSLRGLEAVDRQRWDQAEDLFAQAVATCPLDERAQRQYALALWRNGRQPTAIEHMREAVRLSGGSQALVVQLGHMYLEQGNLAEAQRQADLALSADRKLAPAWALQGEVHRAAGRQQEALASFHRALSYQEHYPEVQIAVAEIYRQLDRPQRALATLTALADEYPPGEEPPKVLYLEGLALKRLGRYREAVDTLAASRDRGTPSAELLFQLGEAQYLAGDPGNARLALSAALDREPDHPAGTRLMAHIERDIERMAALDH
jgi:tetratricopeptide (TPR) repeat protein